MANEKRRLHQNKIHKLMHKLGGRFSHEWYLQRIRINKKVARVIAFQKQAKLMRQLKLAQEKDLRGAVHDAMTLKRKAI